MRFPRPLQWPTRFLFGRMVAKSRTDGLPLQTGVLPWRRTGGRSLELLLVTGRNSKRWSIPKGWPMRGRSLAEAGAREAYEEAGVEGQVEEAALGSFAHAKNHPLVGRIEVRIVVHALAVEKELEEWPERGERSRRWFDPDEAARTVASAELRTIITRFAARLAAEPRR